MAEKENKNQNAVLKKIAEELKDQKQSTERMNENLSKIVDVSESEERLQFQDEQNLDLQMNLMKNQNALLEGILEKIGGQTTASKKDKKSFIGSILGRFMPKGIMGLFLPMFKTLFSPKGFMRIGKKLLKFVGAPILALLAGFDFAKGFKNAEEIVGRSGFAAQYQAGISQVISGITLGMLDPKAVSKGFDKVNDWIFTNLTVPIMDFILNIPTKIAEMFSSEGLSELKNKILNIPAKIAEMFSSEGMLEPLGTLGKDILNIPIITDIVSKVKFAFDTVKSKLMDNIITPIQSFVTTAVESINDIIQKILMFGEKIKEIALSPIEKAKSFFTDTQKKYDEFKDKFSFSNIFGGDEEQQKQIQNDVEKKSIETLVKPETKTEATTNNNVLTNNSNTNVNQGNDMSTRSDDLYNQNPSFSF